MDLPIEIMQQRRDAPLQFVLAQLLHIGNHARLDGKRVLPQSLGLDEFADNIPSLFTSQHEFHHKRFKSVPGHLCAYLCDLCASALKKRAMCCPAPFPRWNSHSPESISTQRRRNRRDERREIK